MPQIACELCNAQGEEVHTKKVKFKINLRISKRKEEEKTVGPSPCAQRLDSYNLQKSPVNRDKRWARCLPISERSPVFTVHDGCRLMVKPRLVSLHSRVSTQRPGDIPNSLKCIWHCTLHNQYIYIHIHIHYYPLHVYNVKGNVQ